MRAFRRRRRKLVDCRLRRAAEADVEHLPLPVHRGIADVAVVKIGEADLAPPKVLVHLKHLLADRRAKPYHVWIGVADLVAGGMQLVASVRQESIGARPRARAFSFPAVLRPRAD